MNLFFIESSSGFKNSSDIGTTIIRKPIWLELNFWHRETLVRTEIGCSAKRLKLRLPIFDFLWSKSFDSVSLQIVQDNVFQLLVSYLFAQSKAWLHQFSLNEQKRGFLAQVFSHTSPPHQQFVAATHLSHQNLPKPRCHLHINFLYVSLVCAIFYYRQKEQIHKTAF